MVPKNYVPTSLNPLNHIVNNELPGRNTNILIKHKLNYTFLMHTL